MKFLLLLVWASLSCIQSFAVDLQLKASYEVPVADELKSVAKFDISPYYILDLGNNQHAMLYQMPEDLVGGSTFVRMGKVFEEGKHRKFEGHFGTADCNGAWNALVCEVKFKNLDINSDDVYNLLALKYSDEELIKRVQVSASFKSDPIGIVETLGPL